MVRNTHYLVCYDISEDDIRYEVADHCKDSGLVRIQYSVFFGLLTRAALAALKLRIQNSISEANADIHFIKVCAQCEKDHKIITSINTDLIQVVSDLESYEDNSEEIDDLVLLL